MSKCNGETKKCDGECAGPECPTRGDRREWEDVGGGEVEEESTWSHVVVREIDWQGEDVYDIAEDFGDYGYCTPHHLASDSLRELRAYVLLLLRIVDETIEGKRELMDKR